MAKKRPKNHSSLAQESLRFRFTADLEEFKKLFDQVNLHMADQNAILRYTLIIFTGSIPYIQLIFDKGMFPLLLLGPVVFLILHMLFRNNDILMSKLGAYFVFDLIPRVRAYTSTADEYYPSLCQGNVWAHHEWFRKSMRYENWMLRSLTDSIPILCGLFYTILYGLVAFFPSTLQLNMSSTELSQLRTPLLITVFLGEGVLWLALIYITIWRWYYMLIKRQVLGAAEVA